jgi:hypothetical protein
MQRPRQKPLEHEQYPFSSTFEDAVMDGVSAEYNLSKRCRSASAYVSFAHRIQTEDACKRGGLSAVARKWSHIIWGGWLPRAVGIERGWRRE